MQRRVIDLSLLNSCRDFPAWTLPLRSRNPTSSLMPKVQLPLACLGACVFLQLAMLCNPSLVAQSASVKAIAKDEGFFADKLYPMLTSAQCDLCHNDNGVASAYGIEFPGRSASREQILALGYQLMEFVDRENPEQSQ